MTAARIRACRACAWLLAAGAIAAPAQAATCDIVPQGVNFGAYDPFEPADLDGVGNIGITCDADVSDTISLSSGTGSYSPRTMTSGADQMAYNLYTNPQRILVWGDGSGGTDTVSATIRTGQFPIYGRIPARQNVPHGAYGDTIFVTITY
jgi:spore coat protein U-like protein